MGHVVNAYLYRLKSTVFWNISSFSKKKYRIYFDINNILVYKYLKLIFNKLKFRNKFYLFLLNLKLVYLNNVLKIFLIFKKSIKFKKNFIFNNFYKKFFDVKMLKIINIKKLLNNTIRYNKMVIIKKSNNNKNYKKMPKFCRTLNNLLLKKKLKITYLKGFDWFKLSILTLEQLINLKKHFAENKYKRFFIDSYYKFDIRKSYNENNFFIKFTINHLKSYKRLNYFIKKGFNFFLCALNPNGHKFFVKKIIKITSKKQLKNINNLLKKKKIIFFCFTKLSNSFINNYHIRFILNHFDKQLNKRYIFYRLIANKKNSFEKQIFYKNVFKWKKSLFKCYNNNINNFKLKKNNNMVNTINFNSVNLKKIKNSFEKIKIKIIKIKKSNKNRKIQNFDPVRKINFKLNKFILKKRKTKKLKILSRRMNKLEIKLAKIYKPFRSIYVKFIKLFYRKKSVSLINYKNRVKKSYFKNKFKKFNARKLIKVKKIFVENYVNKKQISRKFTKKFKKRIFFNSFWKKSHLYNLTKLNIFFAQSKKFRIEKFKKNNVYYNKIKIFNSFEKKIHYKYKLINEFYKELFDLFEKSRCKINLLKNYYEKLNFLKIKYKNLNNNFFLNKNIIKILEELLKKFSVDEERFIGFKFQELNKYFTSKIYKIYSNRKKVDKNKLFFVWLKKTCLFFLKTQKDCKESFFFYPKYTDLTQKIKNYQKIVYNRSLKQIFVKSENELVEKKVLKVIDILKKKIVEVFKFKNKNYKFDKNVYININKLNFLLKNILKNKFLKKYFKKIFYNIINSKKKKLYLKFLFSTLNENNNNNSSIYKYYFNVKKSTNFIKKYISCKKKIVYVGYKHDLKLNKLIFFKNVRAYNAKKKKKKKVKNSSNNVFANQNTDNDYQFFLSTLEDKIINDNLSYSTEEEKEQLEFNFLNLMFFEEKEQQNEKLLLLNLHKNNREFRFNIKKKQTKNFFNLKLKKKKSFFYNHFINKILSFNFFFKLLMLKKNFVKYLDAIFNHKIIINLFIFMKNKKLEINSDLISEFFITRLKQKNKFMAVLKPVLRMLKKKHLNNTIYGYAILMMGRFSRKDRATYKWFTKGVFKRSNKLLFIDYSNRNVILKFSLCSFKISIIWGSFNR